MRERRVKARRDRDLLAGPRGCARRSRITGADNGNDLVARARSASSTTASRPPTRPGVSVRIGLAPGRGDEHPWRFFVPGDPNLSRGPRMPG